MTEQRNENLTKEEQIKEKSNYLRGTIKEELTSNSSNFNETNNKLLKFHGIYQQDNRDSRQERIAKKLEKEYSFMIRTKLPAGELSSKQYLRLDEISNKYANKTLRLTTRQTIQFHGVIKGDLHKTLNEINKELITTYGACGDVVRNVMACPVCDIDPKYSVNLTKLAKEISDHLLPNTKAYYEIWVDEEKIELDEKEPLYGKTYLPRKFKIGLALPNDNCIDIFTQDVGVVAITEHVIARSTTTKQSANASQNEIASSGLSLPRNDMRLEGFNLLIGGGLGHHHNKPETYPRLASELCFITPDKLIKTIEQIVTIQRDYGGRVNRKHARMKYLIDDRGIDWFKTELEKRIGFKLEQPRKIPEYKMCDHIGWNKQSNDLWYLGLFIENGRVLDTAERKIKTGLKEIIEKFNPGIRLTPHQNIVLTNLKEEGKNKINEILAKYKIYTKETVSSLRRNSMACPALPTCGLALAEAERALPDVIDNLEKLGLGNKKVSIRMSGCPNSCSRPPMAEIGIIGMSADKYNIYTDGNFEGIKLNKLYKENIAGTKLSEEIASLLRKFPDKS